MGSPPHPPAPGPGLHRRGRLTVLLGYAPASGKTSRLAEEGARLRAAGADVVAALVEPRGRPGAAARLGGLELLPRRRVEYRGVAVEELDLDAALARRPEVALVDDVSHVNAPDARHRRRHQDVEALLAAGISVVATLDVQHLESLNDLVERTIGVRVRETVPDTFLERADEVVALDLPVEALLERLRAGRPGAAVDGPLPEPGHLAVLRELALREVAGRLARASRAGAAGPAGPVGGPAPAQPGGRLAVALSSLAPRGAALLRQASRLAGRLATDWFAVHVETPREAPGRIGGEARRRLEANLDLARELGAEVVRLRGGDPAEVLLDFARSHGVSDLVVGRSRLPWWIRLAGRTLPQRLLRAAEELDLHVVALDEGAGGEGR